MKKGLCVLLAMMMVICLLPMTVTATSTIWDGTVAHPYAGGNGTLATPYLIANGEQLAYFAYQVNLGEDYADEYFILTDDIALNDTTNWQSWNETVAPTNIWTPIGTNDNQFGGTFDGSNHTISGMYVNVDSIYAGLFGCIDTSSTIKNLGVIDSYVRSYGDYSQVGAIAGSSYGYIFNCYNTGTVVGKEAGGICSYTVSSSARIANCWNTGTVTGLSYAGGIVAKATAGPSFERCYNEGAITSNGTSGGATGGLLGSAYDSSIRNCFNAGGINSTSGYAGGLMGEAGNCSIQTSYNVASVAGVADGTGLIAGAAESNATFSGNYYLDDATLLYAIGQYYNYSIEPATIMNNQDISGTAPLTDAQMQVQGNFASYDFTNVWTMAGNADYLYPELKNMPVFGEPDPTTPVWSGTVAIEYEGGAGTQDNPYQISNGQQLAFFAQQVNAGTSYAGVHFVLTQDIALNEPANWQTWSSTVIPANSWTPIGTSLNRFAGKFNGDNHMVSGVYVNTTDSAGLFGYTTNTSSIGNLGVIESYFEGDLYAGSIAGVSLGSIQNCYNTGFVVGNDAGGLCGSNAGFGSRVTNCWNTGAVDGLNCAGGIVGYATNDSNIEFCYNAAAVTAENVNGHAGGICGNGEYVSIGDCYNTGVISAPQGRAGGIMGIANANGTVDSNCSLDISRSYNAGKVTGAVNLAGMIVGYASHDEYLTFSFSSVYYLDDKTALVAVGEYLDDTTHDYNLNIEGTAPLTDAEMKNEANFVSFDFVNDWMMESDLDYPYPKLQHMPVMPEPELKPNPNPDPEIEPEIWDRTAATDFDSGTGYVLDPYIIKTAEQLAYFRDQVNGGRTFSGEYIKLESDIRLNDTAEWETWSDTVAPVNTWIPIGPDSYHFAGTFDGGNHKISGMYVNTTGYYAALFTTASSLVTIKNLGVIESYVRGDTCSAIVAASAGSVINCFNTGTIDGGTAAGICGWLESETGKVINCWNSGRITGISYVGGVVAETVSRASIERCYNNGEVTNNSNQGVVGGIVGAVEDTTIKDCYNSGILSAPTGVAGGILGVVVISATVENCYNAGSITGTTNQTGAIAGTVDAITISGSYYLDDETALIAIGGVADPTGVAPLTDAEMQEQDNFISWDFVNIWTIVGEADYHYPELRNMQSLPNPGPEIWSGTSATDFEGGTGTREDPYLIMTAEQLAYFRDEVNGGRTFNGEHVMLGAELLLNDTFNWQFWDRSAPAHTWIPIGSRENQFEGTFDGGNYPIRGIYIKSTDENVGLFGYASQSSTICSLGVMESHIEANSDGSHAGAIVGHTDGNVLECYNTGTVVGCDAGGICGRADMGRIIKCWNSSVVIGTAAAGGIAGYIQSQVDIEYCFNKGAVTSSVENGYAGGLVGNSEDVRISNCYNEGRISANLDSGYAGGISGKLSGVTEYSYNVATVTGAENRTGLISGNVENDGSYFRTYYLDDATALTAVGGATNPAGTEPLTDAQMQDQANFVSWDFTYIWKWAQEGGEFYPYAYPILRPMWEHGDQSPFLPIMTRGGAARYDRTGIRFGASVSFVDLTVMNVGDTIDYGFSLNGLRNDALTIPNWIRLSAASAEEGFTGFTWTAEMEAATTTAELTALIRATGIKVYEYDAETITFAVILLNMPLAAQDSLWVFEPYVTINADTSFGETRYTSVNRILTDVPSSVFVPGEGGEEQ